MSASFELLDQSSEDALHKRRLLNVEEKPFKRITKRLLNPSISLFPPSNAPATPPPDISSEDPPQVNEEAARRSAERKRWREDVLLDFAAFESSIVRIQFLLNANVKERERYAKERERILRTQTEVRENTKTLQSQLVDAQGTLALRKEYDHLAEKITENKLLRPREEQASNLQKLREEIQELEREKEQYEVTWRERREQFEKIVEQGMQLRRLIRDEKEEAERMEGLMGEDNEEGGSSTARASRDVTPLPTTQQIRGSSPNIQHNSPTPGGGGAQQEGMLGIERNIGSRDRSPLRNMQVSENPLAEVEQKVVEEDTDMAEDGEVSAAPIPVEGLVKDQGVSEGQKESSRELSTKDNMDTT